MADYSKRYTPEFKRRAVELYRSKQPVTYAEVARELGVDAGSLSDWVKRAGASAAKPSDNPFQMAEDLKRLKRENDRLKRDVSATIKTTDSTTVRSRFRQCGSADTANVLSLI